MQQIASLYIIFVKKIVFLLFVLTPLGLGLVRYLRNRSEAIGTAVQRMLANAASRSFVVVEIRCDGEEVIGSFTFAMPSSNIVASISGPDQHVAVVECMARTPEKRYRCHELALPFVTTRTLIVWCMMLCIHSVNLQSKASSVDKVSPYSRFSGLKFDAK